MGKNDTKGRMGKHFSIIGYDQYGAVVSPKIPKGLLTNIQKGHRYALDLENSIELVHLLLALFEKQAVAVPIPPQCSSKQKVHVIEHADVHGVFYSQDGVLQFSPRTAQIELQDEIRYIIYSSGSTGEPKGIMLGVSAVNHNALAVANLHNFAPDSPHATCLPFYHCNALIMSLLGCYLSDTPLIMMTRFNAEVYFKLIDKHQVTTASIVPALLDKLILDHPKWPVSLRYLITAAAPLRKDLAREFYNYYQNRICQGYGLTEAVNFSFVMPLLDTQSFVQQYVWQTPPVGLKIPGTDFKIGDDGEVLVKGPNLMHGYWRAPENTRQAFTADNWLRTGDIGALRGNFLVLVGRKKETVNRGGESLHPNQLEEIYSEILPTGASFIVAPVKHRILDNEIAIVFERQTKENAHQQLFNLCCSLPMLPAAISFTNIPKTATGKPQRLRIATKIFVYQQGHETILTALWMRRKRYLGKPRIYYERTLNKILSKKYQFELNRQCAQNVSSSEDEIATLIYHHLRDYLNWREIDLGYQLTAGPNVHFTLKNGTQIFVVGDTTVEQLLDRLKNCPKGDTIVTFCVPEFIGENIPNPFLLDSTAIFCNLDPAELIAMAIKQNSSLTIAPIKFKNFIFANFIEVTIE